MKIYLASPFFNEEQIERIEYIEELLSKYGFDVYSPRLDCSVTLSPDASNEDREAVFNDNLTNIKDADFVLAITDGKDMGTIFEAGYAYALNKPILYYAETLGSNKFNLMLAESAVLGTSQSRGDIERKLITICDCDSLEYAIETLANEKYAGSIE